jgi:hypothetical protein
LENAPGNTSPGELRKNAFNNNLFQIVFGDSFDAILEKAFVEAVNADSIKMKESIKKVRLSDKEEKFLGKLLATLITDPDKWLPLELSKKLNSSLNNKLVISIIFLKKSTFEKEEIFDCEFVWFGLLSFTNRFIVYSR